MKLIECLHAFRAILNHSWAPKDKHELLQVPITLSKLSMSQVRQEKCWAPAGCVTELHGSLWGITFVPNLNPTTFGSFHIIKDKEPQHCGNTLPLNPKPLNPKPCLF